MRRKFGLGLAVLVVLAFLGVIFVFALANTDWGHRQVQKRVVGAIQNSLHGLMKVGSVSGNLLSGFTLHDLVITDSAGAPLAKVDSASATYGLRSLYAQRIEFNNVRLTDDYLQLLDNHGRPRKIEFEEQEEANIVYVALTRAKKALCPFPDLEGLIAHEKAKANADKLPDWARPVTAPSRALSTPSSGLSRALARR